MASRRLGSLLGAFAATVILANAPPASAKPLRIDHPLWANEELKQALRRFNGRAPFRADGFRYLREEVYYSLVLIEDVARDDTWSERLPDGRTLLFGRQPHNADQHAAVLLSRQREIVAEAITPGFTPDGRLDVDQSLLIGIGPHLSPEDARAVFVNWVDTHRLCCVGDYRLHRLIHIQKVSFRKVVGRR